MCFVDRELEDRIAREEAEAAALEAEEKAKSEARELKKAAQRERREILKKEGKLLTGKAKVEADRLAAIREQLLAKAAERGESPGCFESGSWP